MKIRGITVIGSDLNPDGSKRRTKSNSPKLTPRDFYCPTCLDVFSIQMPEGYAQETMFSEAHKAVCPSCGRNIIDFPHPEAWSRVLQELRQEIPELERKIKMAKSEAAVLLKERGKALDAMLESHLVKEQNNELQVPIKGHSTLRFKLKPGKKMGQPSAMHVERGWGYSILTALMTQKGTYLPTREFFHKMEQISAEYKLKTERWTEKKKEQTENEVRLSKIRKIVHAAPPQRSIP